MFSVFELSIFDLTSCSRALAFLMNFVSPITKQVFFTTLGLFRILFSLVSVFNCSYVQDINFIFLEKGFEQVPPPHFVYDFSGKMFLMLHFFKDTMTAYFW